MKIGLISVYFGLFDDALPPTFRQEREALNKKIEKGLSQYGKVINPGLIDNEKTALIANELYRKEKVQTLVYSPTMAAPPIYLKNSIKNLNLPILCISPQEFKTTPKNYNTDLGTEHSTLVGLTMGTNVLVREGIKFNVYVIHVDDIPVSKEIEIFFNKNKNATQIIDTDEKESDMKFSSSQINHSKVADAVNKLKNYPLITLGEPISGYLDVEMTEKDADLIGVNIKKISKKELNNSFKNINDIEVENNIKEISDKFKEGRKIKKETLERSCRLNLALNDIAEKNKAIGGTVNCHGDFFRWNPDIGITGCLGVSCLAEKDTLFSCTGDVPTSIALVAAKIISGSALYCECYTIDFKNDTILIANGGEGDFTINSESPNLRILPEDHYMGEFGPGVAVQFDIEEMEATLISISPTLINKKNEWRIILAEGTTSKSAHQHMEGPNTMFKFKTKSAKKGFEEWALLGATHHAVLMPGYHKKEFEIFCNEMNINLKVVG